MPRMRTLKPGFFSNDVLAEVTPLGRLLFQGLWCLADREGRLEDRPRRIKAEIIPYDDADVPALLDDLARLGFLIRYESDGQRFIQVTNFAKHQNPHIKEPASIIPAPSEHSASTVPAPDEPCMYESWDPVTDTDTPLPPSGAAEKDPDPSGPSTARRSQPKPKPKPKHEPITDQDIEDLVEKHASAFGSRQAVRDEIENALNHQARLKNFKERLYVDNWLRRSLEQRGGSLRLVHSQPARKVIDRTGTEN